jgi:hypothetical protein
MKWLGFVILLFLCSTVSVAQDNELLLKERIEFLALNSESEEPDFTGLIEQWTYFLDHPLNLNAATEEELNSLGLLTGIQIQELLIHRKMCGKLISMYELQSLNYWDLSIIHQLVPFVVVDDKIEQLHLGVKELSRLANFELMCRFQSFVQKKNGYEEVPDSIKSLGNSYYRGNKHHYYTRMRSSYQNKLSIGITAEKDPGEQFFKGSQQQGFDFYSAHAFYNAGKYLKTIALGDYQVQFGQGLNFWTGYSFGKMADATVVKKNAQVLRPYTSVDENRFLRGGASVIAYRSFSVLTFASRKKVDARIDYTGDEEGSGYASSLNLSGLHRTTSELARKSQLIEQVAGTYVSFQKNGFSLGGAGVYQGTDHAILNTDETYNLFKINQKESVNLSIDYSLVRANMHFFGELVQKAKTRNKAQVHGVIVALDKDVSFSVIYRNYDTGYTSFYNAGFSEGSSINNEKGIYMGWKVRMTKSLEVNTYIDIFTFPWVKYQVNQPSRGYEFLIQPTFQPTKQLTIYFRYRNQLKQKNSRDSDGTVLPVEDVKQCNYRFNLDYRVSEAFTLRSRLEFVKINRVSNKPEHGVCVYQDVIYKPKNNPFEFTVRYALFETDSYDSRIYAYENNALFVYSLPAYYNTGSRAYVLVRYTLGRKVDLWFRYASFVCLSNSSLGAGPEKVSGYVKADVTVQLRIKF